MTTTLTLTDEIRKKPQLVLEQISLEALKEAYLAKEDPTEYFFAKEVFNDWDFWKDLRSYKGIAKEVEKWREELEVKLRAKSFIALLEEARDKNSRNSYDANKMIVREGWKLPEASAGRGRPSKEEIKKELAKQAQLEKEILENAKRAGIVVELEKAVNG